jgi:hypothetical protein
VITPLSIHLSARALIDAVNKDAKVERSEETAKQARERCALYASLYGFKAHEALTRLHVLEARDLWNRAKLWMEDSKSGFIGVV